MGKFGFGSDDEPTVDVSGLGKGTKERSHGPKITKQITEESVKLGYEDRRPRTPQEKGLSKRKPGRKPPGEPKVQLMISGPESVIVAFRNYCDANGNVPYWEGLKQLLTKE